MRGVKSLAYDWIMWLGHVRARVALLLRCTECKPTPPDFFVEHYYASPIVLVPRLHSLGGDWVRFGNNSYQHF